MMGREPSVSDALERTYEAGQSLVIQRIDLLVAESKVLAQTGALVLVGAVIAVLGWIYLMHGLIDGLSQRYARFSVELVVGAVHVAIAALLVVRARSGGDE